MKFDQMMQALTAVKTSFEDHDTVDMTAADLTVLAVVALDEAGYDIVPRDRPEKPAAVACNQELQGDFDPRGSDV